VIRALSKACLVLLFVGCVQVRSYTAAGSLNVNTKESPSRAAVAYWYADVGRLWYGGKYLQVENTAHLSICNSLPVELVDKGPGLGVVILADSNGDDYLSHTYHNGVWTELKAPLRQLGGNPTCGQLFVRHADNTLGRARFADIERGNKLVLAVTCTRGSTAALQPALYDLGPVQMSEMDEKPAAPPSPASGSCPVLAPGFVATPAVQPPSPASRPTIPPTPAPCAESPPARPEPVPATALAP